MQALGSHNFPCIHFKLHSVTNFKVLCQVLDIIMTIISDEGTRWTSTIETSTFRVVNPQVSFETFQARIASQCVCCTPLLRWELVRSTVATGSAIACIPVSSESLCVWSLKLLCKNTRKKELHRTKAKLIQGWRQRGLQSPGGEP